MAHPRSILILSTLGGKGHLQAAKAKRLEMLSAYPQAQVIEKEILYDFVGKIIAYFFVRHWNIGQTEGNVKTAERMAACIPIAGIAFFVPVFLHVFFLLLHHPIDLVIDTQPTATAATVKAIRLASYLRNRPIQYHKVLTELPTSKVEFYYRGIRKLKKERALVRLITRAPLLQEGETDAHFWQKHCGLLLTQVLYEPLPILPPFQRLGDQARGTDLMRLLLKEKQLHELHLINETISRSHLPEKLSLSASTITLYPEEKVATLLLGSQSTDKATLVYVKHYINYVAENPSEPHVLFVFCHQSLKRKDTLQQRVHKMVTSMLHFPKQLRVIPLGMEEATVIAHLYHRSDLTITRSGGLTAMELLAVAGGKILIHSEDESSSLIGMPSWESGNAAYLKEKKGARIVSPATFPAVIRQLYSTTSAKLDT